MKLKILELIDSFYMFYLIKVIQGIQRPASIELFLDVQQQFPSTSFAGYFPLIFILPTRI